jgi:hypothetical protein
MLTITTRHSANTTLLCLHKVSVTYALPVLLPHARFLRFGARSRLTVHFGLEETPEPFWILVIRKRAHGLLALEVVHTGEDSVRWT